MSTATQTPAAARRTGLAAIALTVVIWAGWIVGTRHGVTHALDPAALGVLRFAVPAIVFAPVWLRFGLLPKSAIPRPLLVAAFASGMPFFLLVSGGMRIAPAADIGPLLPGTMPFFVALLSRLFFGERIGMARIAGFALILAGVGVMLADSLFAGGDIWAGRMLVVAGALSWAVFTILFRRSGLGALEGSALFGVWSFIFMLPVGALPLYEAAAAGHLAEIAGQAVVQGVLSGVAGAYLYAVAIRSLGASQAAAATALIPALAALLGWLLLGEAVAPATLAGIVATSAGVAFASGAVRLPRRTGCPAAA